MLLHTGTERRVMGTTHHKKAVMQIETVKQWLWLSKEMRFFFIIYFPYHSSRLAPIQTMFHSYHPCGLVVRNSHERPFPKVEYLGPGRWCWVPCPWQARPSEIRSLRTFFLDVDQAPTSFLALARKRSAFEPVLEGDLGGFHFQRNPRSYVLFPRRCLISLV